MKRKVGWLVVSCWMVAALLLASCAPAVVEDEEKKVAPQVPKEVPKEVVVPKKGAEMVKWTGTKLDGTVVEKMIEKPRYGGVYVTAWPTEPTNFDERLGGVSVPSVSHPAVEELFTRDWTRGPGGTEEWSATAVTFPAIGHERGVLAESWELSDPTTFVFHIRQGIRWQNKPPMNGRGLTAEDVAWSMRRTWTKGSYMHKRTPFLIDQENRENSIYVSPTDKWAVVLKFEPARVAGTIYQSAVDHQIIVPREVVEEYGDMKDWRNVVGTGPYFLEDYVGGSAVTYVRNPNYWQKDPFFPENQLPYLDGFKVLIIPDASTRQAALRTGKIDMIPDLNAEEARPVMKTNPELEQLVKVGTLTPTIWLRMDNPELPWADIRVRQALMMAVNQQEILDEYFEGDAVPLIFPFMPIADYMDAFVPIEQNPQSVQEQFEYHPDKAKQLLAEAGYPDGFKAEVITPQVDGDLLSIVKNYWADIGVDLELAVRDASVHKAIGVGKTYTQMYFTWMRGTDYPYTLTGTRPGAGNNYGMINDPKVEETFQALNATYFDEPKRKQILKDFGPYMLEQAWRVMMPVPNQYTLWQPWLKGFYGSDRTSHLNTLGHTYYVWIDQELKEAMGY